MFWLIWNRSLTGTKRCSRISTANRFPDDTSASSRCSHAFQGFCHSAAAAGQISQNEVQQAQIATQGRVTNEKKRLAADRTAVDSE